MLIDFNCKVNELDLVDDPVACEFAEYYKEYTARELCSHAAFLLYLASLRGTDIKDVEGIHLRCDLKGDRK